MVNTTPYNEIAEQSVLGSMLLDMGCIADVMPLINADCFYNPSHKETFEAIQDLFIANKPIDVITLAEQLKTRGTFDKVGAENYLVEIAMSVPTSANVKHYAEILRQQAKRRKLLKISADITNLAQNSEIDIDETLVKAESLIIDVDNYSSDDDFHTADKIFAQFFAKASERTANKQAIPGISTGFGNLDIMTGGLMGGYLYVIAARPAMGKSALATSIASNVNKQNKTVAFFSLEMGEQLIMQRMIAEESLISNTKMKLGLIEKDDWGNIVTAGTLVGKSNFIIDDTGGVSADYIQMRCRKLNNKLKKKDEKLELIVVDYLQFMGGKGRDQRAVIEDNCRKLKALAKEFNAPVILLSQLSRENEKRTDKRPMLSDLRETGAIEQDADLVAMIYRDDYYNPDSEQAGISEIIICKQRDGATGTIKLGWSGEHTRFYNLKK